ncbi:hypothetical protein SDC9_75100 [bioreactor metagenome]|uniref:Uncharacterized protein n=1 Tax=bioreactor metagenome TaxID=1076179 RepID=A0A644YR49_9ZZZZ
MSVTGMTSWQICQKCGRKFLAAARKPSSDGWPADCPKCRAETTRKVLSDITAKWLKK